MARRRTPEARAERLAQHAAETDPAVVLAAAGRLLEARSRSVADLRGRLVKAGYPAALIESAIGRLVDLALLDDDAYARGWLEARDRSRPRGERFLRQELRLRGVPADVAAAALEARREAATGEARDGDGPAPADRDTDGIERVEMSADEAAARRLLERRSGSLIRLADRRERRHRAYALLARNGFDPDVAARVTTAWLAGGADAELLEPDLATSE